MDLFLLRHAEAGEAPRDEIRELTAHGHEQARAVAAGTAWLAPGIGAVVSSPLPRAMQTAQPVAAALGLRVEASEALATGHAPEEALALLSGRGERMLLVGHEPQLSTLVLHVTGGRIHMRKAMLARVELHNAEPVGAYGELAWLLSWRHLERLGQG